MLLTSNLFMKGPATLRTASGGKCHWGSRYQP